MKQKIVAVAVISAVLLIANICVAPSIAENHSASSVQVGCIFPNLPTGI